MPNDPKETSHNHNGLENNLFSIIKLNQIVLILFHN